MSDLDSFKPKGKSEQMPKDKEHIGQLGAEQADQQGQMLAGTPSTEKTDFKGMLGALGVYGSLKKTDSNDQSQYTDAKE